MIDDTAIRTAMEAVLGGTFASLPVSRVNEGTDPQNAFIRTYFVREPRTELYRGIRRAKGMFGVLVHVPEKDGIDKAEELAKQIPPLFRISDTENAAITVGSLNITVREVSVMSTYRGVDEQTGNERWLVCPVQIDWRVDITA